MDSPFGFSFGCQFFMDKCLIMGCSLSCSLLKCFLSALQEVILENFAFHQVSHILDDFIFIALAKSLLCQQQLDCFLAIVLYAGIPIKTSETIFPSYVVPIHGIEVNNLKFTASLPADKIDNLVKLLISFKDKWSACLKAWQSLIGSLSFATQVVRPGHPFISKFIHRIAGVTKPQHHVKLNSDIRKEVRIWLAFLLFCVNLTGFH